jgi:thiol-disulfide isomerase/thioredoxin
VEPKTATNRIWPIPGICRLLLLGCLSAGGLAAAEVASTPDALAPQSPAIHFPGGDFVAGHLLDSDDPRNLLWGSDAFAAPLRFPLSGVQAVQFPLSGRPRAAAGPYCFELAGGDTLSGALTGLDKQEAVLEIPGLGTLHVERSALHRFYRASSSDLIFSGPGALDGWQTPGPPKAWREEGGQLRTDQPGAVLRRDFLPPPMVRYEFELSWTARPSFELLVGEDAAANRAAFRLETWGDELVALRETERQADLCVLQRVLPGPGQVHLLALFDLAQGRLLIYSAAGEKLGEVTVPGEKSSALPTFTKGMPGLLLRAVTGKPLLPGGLRLVNHRGDIKLERLTISRWSGLAPQPATVGQAIVQQIDGTSRATEVRSFDAAAHQLIMLENGAERRLDERQLQDVVLSQPQETAPRAVRLVLASGARISGELLKIQQHQLTFQCPGIREPLVLPVKGLHALLVLKPDANAQATAPHEGRLELAGVSLHGQLVNARSGEHSCLVFQPRQSDSATPLAAGVSGRLVYREPPPPKPAPTEEEPQTPARVIANGVRTLLGKRFTPAARPAPPGDCLLHLRSGDTIPCRVQNIDEQGVWLKSTVSDASFVPHERIKALELRPDSPPVKVDKTKTDRLLTLPRMQRDNPPEQLIRSLEGDYLRGRLLAMDDKRLTVELRLETKTLDREQVARIIWLHPDEAAGATVAARPPAANAARLPAGTRVQAVPTGGKRLTFFAQELAGETLSGESDVLGACRVNLNQLEQLLIGETIEQAAATLAFHQWKLRPAAEPLPDPEPGAEPGSSEGLESVLVGKPAPDIDLDLLDGKKFRLADYKNKVLVLDFWASWCGPCLQAMPQVDAVAREFAAQDVVLVAINLQETPERIRTALERLKLETAVALDLDGRIAERYGATAIPQTVIIDKSGKVARLFVGGGAHFDEQLRLALKGVLGGAASEKQP